MCDLAGNKWRRGEELEAEVSLSTCARGQSRTLVRQRERLPAGGQASVAHGKKMKEGGYALASGVSVLTHSLKT